MGEFSGGCYVQKEDNILEAEKGFYNTKTHELKAISRVQMRNNDYEVLSDSVIFNTQTEDAQYFTNTHIWNKNDEYLNTQAGTYTKKSDLHNLTRRSYLLQPEREIWSDSIMYYRTDGHIIARRNIQMDDTTQKILGFADYAEWWDEPGNAFFTRRPSLINYDPELTDSIYISADTLWLYTIAVEPPKAQKSEATQEENSVAPEANSKLQSEESGKGKELTKDRGEERLNAEPSAESALKKESNKGGKNKGKNDGKERGADVNKQPSPDASSKADSKDKKRGNDEQRPTPESGAELSAVDSTRVERDSLVSDTLPATDTIATADSTAQDTTKYTAKQLRRRAKLERKAAREAIKARERMVRDSLDSLEQIKLDSVQKIRDSLLKMKIDTIIAERIERSSRLADEEKERLERLRIKAEQRRREKIDKAKARAIKRGKEYTGEDYDPNDTAFMNIDIPERPRRDESSKKEESAGSRDSIQSDSTLRDTLPTEIAFPKDSSYKMIKAYRNVKMFRSESQMACDSLTILNTDSIIRMYKSPVMWNDNNQILSDSAMIHTERQRIKEAHFYGSPIMGIEIDTAYYNQVKGKEMISFFDNGKVYRNDVNGNAQTIYYLQEEEGADVTALMYIESSAITFYLDDGSIDKISYKQNPEYVLYPMEMVPESQERKLDGFDWQEDRRPTRVIICDRRIVKSNRERAAAIRRPTFPIMERIDYDRRRLVENKMWKDRKDRLTPDVIDWRNSRESYKKRKR